MENQPEDPRAVALDRGRTPVPENRWSCDLQDENVEAFELAALNATGEQYRKG